MHWSRTEKCECSNHNDDKNKNDYIKYLVLFVGSRRGQQRWCPIAAAEGGPGPGPARGVVYPQYKFTLCAAVTPLKSQSHRALLPPQAKAVSPLPTLTPFKPPPVSLTTSSCYNRVKVPRRAPLRSVAVSPRCRCHVEGCGSREAAATVHKMYTFGGGGGETVKLG